MCVAVPGRIVQILGGPGLPMATVEVGGIRRKCCLAYLPEAVIGDYTIIQSGFAITILDEKSALASLALFEELGLIGPGQDQERALSAATGVAGRAQRQWRALSEAMSVLGRGQGQEQSERAGLGQAGGHPT
jgi:hydrogenase expression/formation protein HypC